MKQRIILIIAGCMLLLSCQQNQTSISGTLPVSDDASIIILHQITNQGKINIDSAELLEQGDFQLNFTLEQPGFFVLEGAAEHESIQFILFPGDRIEIYPTEEKITTYPYYTIKGSEESVLLQELIQYRKQLKMQTDSLNKVYHTQKRSADFIAIKKELDTAFLSLHKEARSFYKAFIRDNPTSLSTIIPLYEQITPRKNVFNWKDDFDTYAFVDSVLYAHYPTVEVVQALHNEMDEARDLLQLHQQNQSLKKGMPAPNFSLPGHKHPTLSLNDLRGNYVLISFWASWNEESRKDHALLKNLYKKHADKSFTIMQVSLDKKRKAWERAIQQDGIQHWYHVSDLSFWDSSVVPLYQIRKLPHYILVNPQGVILSNENDISRIQTHINTIFQ